MKIKDLKFDKRNANLGTERGRALLEKSLQTYGAGRSILIDKNNNIIAGNKTVEVASEAGFKNVRIIETDGKEIIAVKRNDLDLEKDTAAKELAIADNRTSELDLEWNSEELERLKNEGVDLGLFFSEKEFAEISADMETENPQDADAQIDQAAEINKKWKVKTGDLWLIGKHRLLCGDSSEKNNIIKIMQNEKATLCFTDPPYGVSIGKKNKLLNSHPGKNSNRGNGRNIQNIVADDIKPEMLKLILKKVFSTWRPYFADDCSIFVCSPQGGGLGMMMMMMMMMQESSLEVKHIINWIKNQPTFSMGRLDYDYQHEPILFTWIKTHKRKKEGQFQTTLWTVNKPITNKEHPTMKPVELPINAILNHTDKNDIIVDMFGGSGTTMLATQNTERICYMTEISPDYCAVILDRMKTAFPDIKIKKS